MIAPAASARPIHVSDHALVRYLERVHGIDFDDARRNVSRIDAHLVQAARETFNLPVDAVRAHIAASVAVAMEARARAIVIDGWRYVLDPVGRTVITITWVAHKHSEPVRRCSRREAAE